MKTCCSSLAVLFLRQIPVRTIVLIGGIVFILFSCNTQVEPPATVLPIPTAEQIDWHKLERYAFVHFIADNVVNNAQASTGEFSVITEN